MMLTMINQIEEEEGAIMMVEIEGEEEEVNIQLLFKNWIENWKYHF